MILEVTLQFERTRRTYTNQQAFVMVAKGWGSISHVKERVLLQRVWGKKFLVAEERVKVACCL